jgi:hypothetical protein
MEDVMSEDKKGKKGSETPPEADEKPVAPEKNPLDQLSDEQRMAFEEANKGLLSALEKERDARKSLEKQAKEVEAQRLKDQDDYKTLAEQLQDELAGVKPKADLVEEYEEALKGVLDAQIEQIPEDLRTLVPEELPTKSKLDWIAKNSSLLMKSKPFNIGAGERGGEEPKGVITLTEDEKFAADATGVSYEDYAKAKNKRK